MKPILNADGKVIGYQLEELPPAPPLGTPQFKEGDRVRIREGDPEEMERRYERPGENRPGWAEDMESSLGREGEVVRIRNGGRWVEVETDDADWTWFPEDLELLS